MGRSRTRRSLRVNEAGKKKVPRQMFVPQAIKRTSGVAANFLWDKTSYVLGVTAAEGKVRHRGSMRLSSSGICAISEATTDPGLKALVAFLKTWFPRRFEELGWPEEMKDQNVVFCLESDRRANICLHDRPAAKAIWARLSAERDRAEAICLVSGRACAGRTPASGDQGSLGSTVVRCFHRLVQSRCLHVLWA